MIQRVREETKQTPCSAWLRLIREKQSVEETNLMMAE